MLGTVTEEVAHGKDALEGRQDKKVAEDDSNDEEGLETLGRPANEYVKKKFGEDNNSKIKLTTDGIDLSNADVGEKVGDVITSGDRVFRMGYQSKYKYIQIDFDRAINGGVGLTGSVFRGGASYGLMSIGYSLAFAPEPFATKALGAGFMLGGLIAGAFTASDAVESAQDVYYGVTNQRDKKSVNFGRELLGEDTYDPLNTLSVAGMPILYDQANYTKVMVEGEAAKRAIIYNPNLTYDENKYLNDYMGKEMPGKVTSKYGDVKTYRYADVVDNNKNTSVSKTPVINKSGASQGINNTTKIASQNPNTSVNKTQSGKATLNVGRQGKHVVGHPNYIAGRDEVTDMQTASNILNDFQGTGIIRNNGQKEVIDTHGKYTGIFVDEKTGQRSITSRFTIHYDSKGTAHIVPANPNPK